MNILIISHFFPPHKGGVETSAYYTAKYLAKYGNNVIILSSIWRKIKAMCKKWMTKASIVLFLLINYIH